MPVTSAAPLFPTLDFLSILAHFNSTLSFRSGWLSRNLAFDLSGHQSKWLFNIDWFFCRGLQEPDIEMISQLFGFLIWHLSLIFQILLITNQNSSYVLLSVFINFKHPFRNFGEGLSVSDIVSHNDSVSTFVVAASNCLKSFLTSSIPNLQFDSFRVNVNSSDFEIDTDGWHEVIIENVVSESQEQWRFTNPWVSNKKNLEKIVVFGLHFLNLIII